MLPLSKLSPSFVKEATAITILYLTTLMNGFAQGFSAVAIPDIKNEMDTSNDTFFIPSIVATSKDLTWFGNKLKRKNKTFEVFLLIASLYESGRFVGAILGGYLGGKYGPKLTITISCLVAGAGWILMAVSPNLALLITGRIICGVGQAFSTANNSMLIAQYRLIKYEILTIEQFDKDTKAKEKVE